MPSGTDFRNALKNAFDVRTYQHTWGIFEYAYRLFEPATRSFDSKSYDAVCLLCRSTVGAACYLYLTRKKEVVGKNVSGTLISPPMTYDGVVRRTSFSELQEDIKRRNVLSIHQLRSLDRIISHGDLIAHLAEATDRLLWSSLKEDPNKNPYEAIPSIDESTASKDLEDTISIIVTLAFDAVKGFT
jgi:hypothetical protein